MSDRGEFKLNGGDHIKRPKVPPHREFELRMIAKYNLDPKIKPRELALFFGG